MNWWTGRRDGADDLWLALNLVGGIVLAIASARLAWPWVLGWAIGLAAARELLRRAELFEVAGLRYSEVVEQGLLFGPAVVLLLLGIGWRLTGLGA